MTTQPTNDFIINMADNVDNTPTAEMIIQRLRQ
jgi:hypothetical protein